MLSRCRSCKAEIVWAVTGTGSPMPFDAEPDPKGEWRLAAAPAGRPPRAVYVPVEKRAGLERELLRVHFASCPDADKHRRMRT